MMETLKSKQEFGKVFSNGIRANHPLVRMVALRINEGDPSKVAFVAPKRLGNAVYRNRCKRILREAARQAELPHSGFLIILLSTQGTHDAASDQVGRAIEGLLVKIEQRSRS